MTPAQQRTLRRFARRAVATQDYGQLVAYVDAYADRARTAGELFTLRDTVKAWCDEQPRESWWRQLCKRMGFT